MKQFNITFLLTVLMSMVGAKALAYDIAVENEDGITLYYNYINGGKELEVTNGSIIDAEIVKIPESVTYMDRTRTVTAISAYAFSDNSYITSVIIPSGVTIIHHHSFYHCSSLKSIDIPDNVIEIGEGAFNGCTNLASISIGSGLKRIGENGAWGAFKYCNNLKKVIIKDLAAYCSIEMGDIFDSPFQYGAKLYDEKDTEITNLEIPKDVTTIGSYIFGSYNGPGAAITSLTMHDKVEKIGKEAFYHCESLLSVNIGNGVKTIGDWAFSFTNLQKITIGTGVKYIGKAAFQGVHVQSITIPDNVLEIYAHAFCHCENLEEVSIGNGVTSIGWAAFVNCSSLKSISIPESTISIGSEAFKNCTSLTTASIPASTISIGSEAFKNCTSLTTVSIPNNGNLERIGEGAFLGSGITSIVIPYKVTTISDFALNVNSLSEVKSYLEVPITISSDVFSKNTYYNASLYVPKGTLDNYKQTDIWKDFVWAEEGDYTSGINPVQSVKSCKSFLYSIDGKRIEGHSKGIRIIQLSNGTTKKVLVK